MANSYFNITARNQEFTLSVNCEFSVGSCLGVYGASGSGKSTLLRCLAGVEKNVSGDVCFDGDYYLKDSVEIKSAELRSSVLCFQESKLFPHLTVAENLAFSEQRAKNKLIKQDTECFPDKSTLISMLNLSKLLSQFPAELSGGEKKRVALAQAFLSKPRLLLLDEPFAFLDSQTQHHLLEFLAGLLQKKIISIILVSHHMQELHYLCEHLITLDKGKLVFSGNMQAALTQANSPMLYQDKPFVLLWSECLSYDSNYGLSTLKTTKGQLFYVLGEHCVGEKVQLKIEANNVSLAVFPTSNTKLETSSQAMLSVLNQLNGSIEQVVLENKHSLLLLVDCGGDKILSKISRLSYERMKLNGLSANTKLIVLVKAASIYEF